MAELPDRAIVHVVDDDVDLGQSVARLLGRHGHATRAFSTPEAMLQAQPQQAAHCLVTDVMMGDTDGFSLAEQIRQRDPGVAIIFMTAWPTTANAVDAIRRYGGLDYLEKPLDEDRLIDAVAEGVAWSRRRRAALARIDALTPRERDVLDRLAQGMSNKMVAAELGLSPKTIEDHRAAIVAKTGASGSAGLIALMRDMRD
ncbi:response regulator [Sphingobium sp.]|uniref:response regulator transcription factor n=1 Tax=Sphingobium sp. TaxID=1912891 RepID=UPI002620B130|nr:response regulator [Sphingobium sp.]